jgi:hypothetical protein
MADRLRMSLTMRIAEVFRCIDLGSSRGGDSCKGLRAAPWYSQAGAN